MKTHYTYCGWDIRIHQNAETGLYDLKMTFYDDGYELEQDGFKTQTDALLEARKGADDFNRRILKAIKSNTLLPSNVGVT